MRVAYITAGAAGMICGSCLKDNTLVRTLRSQGRDCVLIATYTPARTEEPDVSLPRVFFGGLSVYLEQKVPWFRRMPDWVQRWLSSRTVLGWVSRFAVQTRAEELGEMTISMLRGLDGYQACEVDRLVGWLAREYRPDLVCLSNILLSGMVPALKSRLGCCVVASLQGDDIFLQHLPEPFRKASLDLIRRNAEGIDAYITPCHYYADFMAEYLGLPRQAMHVVYPGISLELFDQVRQTLASENAACSGELSEANAERAGSQNPVRIGYLARICPDKGLHLLVEAVELLIHRGRPVKLEVAGYLSPADRAYLDEQRGRAARNGWEDRFHYWGELDYPSKVRFLCGLDILSVPTVYREPKGLYVLEAWAAGVPVVQPAHGSFPELIGKSGGGVVVPPGDGVALADALEELCLQPERRRQLGRLGQQAVETHFFHARRMAEETWRVWESVYASRNRANTGAGADLASAEPAAVAAPDIPASPPA